MDWQAGVPWQARQTALVLASGTDFFLVHMIIETLDRKIICLDIYRIHPGVLLYFRKISCENTSKVAHTPKKIARIQVLVIKFNSQKIL
jgi:hypothetical protein